LGAACPAAVVTTLADALGQIREPAASQATAETLAQQAKS